ncbi:MAG: NADH-quinone oxidoreductase subunit N [Gemmatimonadaceae bacterium]|nr:NADH-quinone oxidoreductase subunit N [Gemmatimonadaceae bacterium]
MTFDLALPSGLLGAVAPELILIVGAMALTLLAAWRPETDAHQRSVGKAALWLLALTAAAVVMYAARGASAAAPGIIAVDGFRWAADLVFLAAAAATIALGIESNPKDRFVTAESHVLVLLSAVGMMILAAARDLMIVFLGIETMSIAVYVLAAMDRRSVRAAEGALKYFLLGAFASAFLLYGIALVYGATGSTNLAVIGETIARFGLTGHTMISIGIAMLLVGFGFKVAAVPFHMWAPDVYEAAPAPITAFMAVAVKAGAFAALLRVWIESLSMMDAAWLAPVWWVAVATMVVGNLIALSQRNVKRLLAYSSIVHAGYLLVAVAAGTSLGTSAFLFYIVAYTLANFGAFAVVAALGEPGTTGPAIPDFEGLWSTRPWLAVGFGVCMLALLGLPVFGGAGFFAKWYVLQAAVTSPHGLVLLAVILVLTSVVSAGYYLDLVRAMFMRPRPEGARNPAVPPYTRVVLVTSVALLLAIGLFPGALATWARKNAAVTPSAARSPFAQGR